MNPPVKAYVLSKKFYATGEVVIGFTRVFNQTEDNKVNLSIYPNINMDLTITTRERDMFELGKEYYVTFEPVEA